MVINIANINKSNNYCGASCSLVCCTANTTPSIDSSNAYSPATGTLSNGKYVYTSERAFNTGDV